MTEDDDAFIRTIVDNPGNDVPRLVYADWLDDRDDPRGPFLRAEVEWAQPWKEGKRPDDPKELRAMAAGLSVQELELFEAVGIVPKTRSMVRLDPLWVARISRPPLGCCCDHLRFEGSGPTLSRKDVDAIDRWPGVKLPVEYKAFLLNHNGGQPIRAPHLAIDPADRQRSSGVSFLSYTFFPVIPPGDPKNLGTLHGQVQRYWDHELPSRLEEWAAIFEDYEEAARPTKAWDEGVIPIGINETTGNGLMLGVASWVEKGVHHFDYDRGGGSIAFAPMLSLTAGRTREA